MANLIQQQFIIVSVFILFVNIYFKLARFLAFPSPKNIKTLLIF